MKVYTRVVIDMATSEVLEADWYEYDGPVAECKKGGKAPKAPDPNVVSAAQTQSNQDTAAYNAALNRVSTYTPQGSSVFSTTGTDPTGAPIYRQDVTLTPDAQALYDQQQAQSRQLGNIAGRHDGPRRFVDGRPRSTRRRLRIVRGRGFARRTAADAGRALQPAGSISRPAVAAARAGSSARRMANQGIVEGSEAWRNALDDQNRARSFDYSQARERRDRWGIARDGVPVRHRARQSRA